MSLSYKPQEYSTVSPYLMVNGANDTIDFLVRVFDAVVLRRFPDANGNVIHAEVRIDDTILMLGDCNADWPAMPAYVHVYVADVARPIGVPWSWARHRCRSRCSKMTRIRVGG